MKNIAYQDISSSDIVSADGGSYQIIQDEKGNIEQGFYGVFDTSKKPYELIDIFEFKKEAQGYLKAIKEKGVDNVDASEFNGSVKRY